jgi:hypothetical protein
MSKISIRFPPRKGTINSVCVAQFPIAVIRLQQTRPARPRDGGNAATNVHVVDFVGGCLDMRFHDLSSCQSETNRFQLSCGSTHLAGRGHRGSADPGELRQPPGRWSRADSRFRHGASNTTAYEEVPLPCMIVWGSTGLDLMASRCNASQASSSRAPQVRTLPPPLNGYRRRGAGSAPSLRGRKAE